MSEYANGVDKKSTPHMHYTSVHSGVLTDSIIFADELTGTGIDADLRIKSGTLLSAYARVVGKRNLVCRGAESAHTLPYHGMRRKSKHHVKQPNATPCPRVRDPGDAWWKLLRYLDIRAHQR